MGSSGATGLFAAVATAALLVGCRHAAPEGAAASPVTTERPRSETLRDVIRATGTIVPAASADLTVYASEPSRIAELTKKEQDDVAVGDVLVRFEMPARTQEMATLQLDVLHATTRSDKAQAELARQTALSARGLTPRNAVDASQREADAAARALTQAQERLDAVRALPDASVVTAQFPGKVLRVWHAAGDAVVPGSTDPIMRVVDPSRVQALVQLSASEASRLVPGQTATVTVLGAGTAPLPALVAGNPSAPDPKTSTVNVRLAFAQPAAIALNSAVAAEVVMGERPGLTVPVSAIGRDDAGSYVLVAGGDSRAHRRDVRVGLTADDRAQIAAGLSADDAVIISGLDAVGDGAPIVPAAAIAPAAR